MSLGQWVLDEKEWSCENVHVDRGSNSKGMVLIRDLLKVFERKKI